MRRRGFLAASLMTVSASRVQAQTPGSGPVVLELFTSQGCSSCPPADAFLGELTQRPGVIGLAWHVDYWNNLGWRDPFARREWTDRQREYARRLGAEVYTPAMVVNGAAMMVGSDRNAVRQAIDQAIPPRIAVTARRTPSGLELEIAPTATPLTGLLATYDPEHSTPVGAGENGGRRLVEYRIVRDAITLERLSPRLTLPEIPPDRGAVVLLRDASWRVVGATDLAPSRGA
jgi:hypothetical protein